MLNRRQAEQLRRVDSDRIQSMRGELSSLRESSKRDLEAAQWEVVEHKRNRQRAMKAEAVSTDALTAMSAELMQVRVALAAELKRAEGAEAGWAECRGEAGDLRRAVATKVRMIEHRDIKLEQLNTNIVDLRAQLDRGAVAAKAAAAEAAAAAAEADAAAAEHLTTIRRINGKSGGRPVTNRCNEELLEVDAWASLKNKERMQARAIAAIGVLGEDGAISEDSLMAALVSGGWLSTLWESKAVWALRLSWVEELKDVLRTVWTPTLTFDLRDALSISYDKLDELRQKLSLHRVGACSPPPPL